MSKVGQIYRECQRCGRMLNIGEDLVCDDCQYNDWHEHEEESDAGS